MTSRWLSPLAVCALACVALACGKSSEIVLAIDTNLTVPTDIDHVTISVWGPTQTNQAIEIDLTDPREPPFPRTLGLVAQGALSPVSISVAGLLGGIGGAQVIQQDARTEFVVGQTRLLEMLLLTSCANQVAMCAGDETCGTAGCIPTARPGTSLPIWTGKLPAGPGDEPAMPVQGRTVWASSFDSAAVDGGTLWAWGRNFDGQLGIGTTLNAKTRQSVKVMKNPTSVGLGQAHSCICDQSKKAWCWGSNTTGQLGTGNLIRSTTPVAVPGLSDCEQIAGGGGHTCAVRTDRTVWCWGQNTSAQTGQPGTDPILAPRMVPTLADVAEVECGDVYSCARRNDGVVLCWGDNKVGVLGDGTTVGRAAPAPVMGVSDAVELAAGRTVVCVRHMGGGQVSCWGNNSDGVLGVATPKVSAVPLAITGISDAIQVTVGLQHACVIRRSGVASCWGKNEFGQLGNAGATNSLTPVNVVDIAGVTSISSGSGHVCARHSAGLSCWGANDVNQLGDGSVSNRNTPISVVGFL